MTPPDPPGDNTGVTTIDSESNPAYRVAQDAFHGPLDLLLYLVRKNEVDVRDVSIANLADQFLNYLRTLRELDVEFVGDFLVTAATLMELKSRSLVPAEEGEAGIERDGLPHDLVRQLLEYRTFKDAARSLEDRADAFAVRLPRQSPEEPAAPGTAPIRPVELWDLVAAFARIMRETQSLAPTTIQVDETPQHVYAEMILDRLRRQSRIAFRDLFTPPYTKARLIGLFLAVLELIKDRQVILEQPDSFGEIWLTMGEPEPAIRAFDEQSSDV